MITVCGDDSREKASFLTKSHTARIEIPNPKLLKTIGAFIIRYKVVGCPDLKLSGDAWYKKNGDVLIVRCNATSQVWHLICQGARWVGEVGNCSFPKPADVDGWTLEQMFNSDDPFPYGVLIAVALGVALGVIIGGSLLCVITMYMKRHRRNFQGYSQPKEQHACTTFPSPVPPLQHHSVSNWLMDAESVVLQEPDIQRTTSYQLAIPRAPPINPDQVVMDCSSFESQRPCVISQCNSTSNSFKTKSLFYESPCL